MQSDKPDETIRPDAARDREAFENADKGAWRDAFFDPCTDDWTKKWFLDGEIGAVSTSRRGMQLTAGPRWNNDAHHVVLWTRDTFEGDLKIEFDYTRMDFERQGVNILYIQAAGSGREPYVTDIAQWNALRKAPAMRMYHDYMNTYHISFSAYPLEGGPSEDWIRARRYMPHRKGLEGTDLLPDHFRTGFFEPGVPHRLAVVKRGNHLHMRVSNETRTNYFHWHNEKLPPIEAGRVGLRHMATRSALYRDFRISAGD